MKIFKTGIVPLDTQLRGGFPASSVVLILEDPGAGADIFSFHFAIEGLKNGEKVLYVTTDDTEDELKENMMLYFDIPPEELSKMKILYLVSPRLRDVKAEKDAKEFLRKIRYDPLNGLKILIQNEHFDRVIINNITYFFMYYDKEEVFKLTEEFSVVSKRNESIFLILMTKGMFDSQTETAMKHVADGVIELTVREVENEVQRRFKVLKLKRVLVPKSILRYDLTEKGIKMESVMRVL